MQWLFVCLCLLVVKRLKSIIILFARRRRPQDKLEFMRQLSTKTISFLVAVLNKPRFLLSLTTVVYESVYFEQIFWNVFFLTIYNNRDLFQMFP